MSSTTIITSSTAAGTSAGLAGSRPDPMAALVQLMKGQAIASMVAFIACGGLTFAFILVYYAYMAFIGGLGACLTNFLLALAITKLPPPRFVPANLKDTPAPPALIVMIVMAAAGGVLMATGRYYDYWFGSYVYIPVFFLGLGLLVAAAPWILLNSIAARLKAQVAGPNRLGAISGGSGTAAGSAPGPAIATAGGMAITATAIANATPSTSAALTPRQRRMQRSAERAAARAARTGRGAGTPAEAGAGQSTSQGQAHAQAQGQATPGSGGSRDADAAKASMQSPTSKGNSRVEARIRERLDSIAIPRCLPDGADAPLRENSWTWDAKSDCDGMGVYTCHHCRKTLCSKHSYWIPDEQFPIITQGKEDRGKIADSEKFKLGTILVGLGITCFVVGTALLVIGIILFFNYVFLIIGGIVLSGGIPLVIIGNKLKLAKAFTTTRYPRYTRPVMTKFDVEVPVFYEHRGYFVAVHCWSCLKEHHLPFFIVSKDILARIHERARQWRFPEHKEAPTDDELAGIGVWAANRFLQSFRLDDVARMPVGVAWPLRTIVRPGATGRRSGDLQPTPAWFLGDRKAGTEFIEQDAFLDEIESVAKEKFRQYLVD